VRKLKNLTKLRKFDVNLPQKHIQMLHIIEQIVHNCKKNVPIEKTTGTIPFFYRN